MGMESSDERFLTPPPASEVWSYTRSWNCQNLILAARVSRIRNLLITQSCSRVILAAHTHTHNTHTVARLQYTNTAQCRRARHVINFRVGIRQLVGVLACNAACQRIIGGARAARFNTRRFDWQARLFALLSDKQCRLSPGSNMGYRPPPTAPNTCTKNLKSTVTCRSENVSV